MRGTVNTFFSGSNPLDALFWSLFNIYLKRNKNINRKIKSLKLYSQIFAIRTIL
jgi:hypothetical protein